MNKFLTVINGLSTVLQKCVSGFYQLLQSPEGILSLLALISVTYLALHKDVGDVAFASVMTLIPAIMVWTQHKINLANIVSQVANQSNNNLPPSGQL